MKTPISDEDVRDFASRFAERLEPGSEIAFRVSAGSRNRFTLCVAGRGRVWPVKLVDDAGRSKYGRCWPREVAVDGLRAVVDEMYPLFLIRPGDYAPADLSGKYGVPERASLRCAYEALSRRVNRRGVTALVADWICGKGYVTRGSVRLGCSMSEAALRMSI